MDIAASLEMGVQMMNSSWAGLANSKWIKLKYNTIVFKLYWIGRQSADPIIALEWIVQSLPCLEFIGMNGRSEEKRPIPNSPWSWDVSWQ